MISGVNHITLAVSDLRRSITFYVDLLEFRLATQWHKGAYLVSGDVWLALSRDSNVIPAPSLDDTHIALSVNKPNFRHLAEKLRAAGVREWRENRSEGASIYFLDPDGHKLELHVGSLASRLAALGVGRLPADPIGETRPRHQTFVVRPLNRADLAANPGRQFRTWLEDAVERGVSDPFAMTLATVDPAGLPTARTVILKDIDERGFIFTSRYDSPKARDLEMTPVAALNFYWPDVGRQVRVRGRVSRLPEAESDRHFRARPIESQLALAGLPQSRPVEDRTVIEHEIASLKQKYAEEPLMRPDWGGYVVKPESIEFWQGRSNRLHDRFRYVRHNDGAWTIERLTP